MPLINLEYDNAKVSDSQVEMLSQAIRDIVSEATKIEDVFVYANTAKIKVQVAPIEIFVHMTASKIENETTLIEKIKTKLKDWKSENNFTHPINLTLIPMNWKIEIGI